MDTDRKYIAGVEYIRADLFHREVDALHAECDRLTALVGHGNSCLWSIEDGSNVWSTECDKVATFDSGFEFCPFCGGKIWLVEK